MQIDSMNDKEKRPSGTHEHPVLDGSEKYLIRPASPEEAGLFYAQTPEQDEALGAIGHVRIDFGHGGREFWHTWHPRGAEELNSPEFKAELDEVVGQLRESVLQDLSSMRSYCYHHGGEIEGGICTQNYGYTVETDRYRYLLRCNPIEGDYQAYLSCFDKQAQEQAAQQASFPDGWREGDICYLITNKAKQYTQPYTVESFDGTYFGVRGRTGSYHRASPGRMFRTREDAVASLMGTTPKEKYDHPDTIKDVDEDKARDPGQKMPLGGRGSFASGDQMQGTTDLKITDYFGNPVTLRPRIELYSVTDFMGEELPGLAIVLDKIGDSSIELEQYAFLTVSFGEHISIKNSAYIDTNNCPFAEQLLEQGIAEPTGLCKTSGFCKYPLWVFKEEFLQAVGGENYQEYAKIYDQHMEPSEENKEGLECLHQQPPKPLVGRVSFANGERIEYTDPAKYLRAVKEELPYQSSSGFRFETLTSDPEVRKTVDDMLYDLYGEENPRTLEDYQEQPEQGMTMGGM